MQNAQHYFKHFFRFISVNGFIHHSSLLTQSPCSYRTVCIMNRKKILNSSYNINRMPNEPPHSILHCSIGKNNRVMRVTRCSTSIVHEHIAQTYRYANTLLYATPCMPLSNNGIWCVYLPLFNGWKRGQS